MEVFEHLPSEKRARIIEGAMTVFSKYGYKKASVLDIAKKAEISKAMVFTYFGSKKGCYEYMCNEMLRVSFEAFDKNKDEVFSTTDFFERVIVASKIKIDVLKRCTPLLSFALSVYYESDEEVAGIKSDTFNKSFSLREKFLYQGIDNTKFKDPSLAKDVGKMVEWMSAGCADEWQRHKRDDLDEVLNEFINCMIILKRSFYKSEYLDECK